MPNRFHWNSYDDENLVAAFDMSTRTPGGLMKNLARTGATYDGTINGVFTPANPLIRAKKTPCMDFGGVNEFIALANPISGLTVMSMVFWVNEDVLGGIFYSRGGAVNNYIYISAIGLLQFSAAGPGTVTAPLKRYLISTTYFIAWVMDGVTTKVYVDAKPRFQVAGGAMFADANAFIGQYSDGSLRFNGRLDNMMFYNIALTPAQIWSLQRSANPR